MPIRDLVLLTLSLSFIAATVTDVDAQRRTSRPRRRTTGVEQKVMHDQREREYRIHVPEGLEQNEAVPMVLFLHGGGGTADVASRMGMTPLADRHKFTVAYPNAIDKHWNDGRDSELFREHDQSIDDVAFLAFLVEELAKKHNIDRNRIFAAGASNGGFMSQRLAIEKPQLFSAVGVIIATMAEPLSRDFRPALPVSVIFMNGTADPTVPYDGGEVRVNLFPQLGNNEDRPSRGTVVSTEAAIALWLKRNGLKDQDPVVTMLPDTDEEDGSRIERQMWTGGEASTSVALYKVIGGGHNVPGGMQYLPERVIGKTNQDIDGLEVIWEFFAAHPRQAGT